MITQSQIEELKNDETLVAIFEGEVLTELSLPLVYDKVEFSDCPMALEPGDDVIVTEHVGGLFFIHFMSWTKSYHYRMPWTTDDQVTHTEGAIYHV